MTAKLTLDNITDVRAYERERDGFRQHIIELKKRRRVAVGPILSIVFENRDTVRFQIQEMARAERMDSDRLIQAELDIYNVLVPGPGLLTATVFLELTSKAELEDWLPRLVGIEEAIDLRIGEEVVHAAPDPHHAARLTREEVTASVHYVRFHLTPDQVEAMATEEVMLATVHPEYRHETRLPAETKRSLLADLHDSSS